MNVIITGASRGIGLAIAEQFASQGHTLFLCARTEAELTAAADTLRQNHPQATIEMQPCDVTSAHQRKVFAVWVLRQAKTIDILVNNAGSFLPGSIYSEPAGTLETMMETNLYSVYHLTRLFINEMMEQRSGHIFNLCSVASIKAYENGGSYSISKWALLGFSRNLREEMKPYGIKVTAVIPGATWTDSWAGSGFEVQRLMEAKDVARMVHAASQLSPQATVEDIVLRPQLGDL